jgi:hypothetical protein
MYRRLDAAAVRSTTELLAVRVAERFPERGLAKVAREAVDVARSVGEVADGLGRPLVVARVASAAVTVALVSAVAVAVAGVDVPLTLVSAAEAVQALESLVNDVVFAGVAVWFVWSLEGRLKRRRALDALAELRALAHVVDMHQLTKDPGGPTRRLDPTASSPIRDLDGALLARYLDYCAELLSMVGKMAALLGQDLDDAVVLATVEEIEELTQGFSQKIWQKIVLIDLGPTRE